MKTNLYLVILFLIFTSCPAMAESDPKLIALIKKDCQFMNNKISLDERLDCMTDYINCAVVNDGETDLTKLTKQCLNKKARERKYEQQR